ncbi:hypothetical protein M758_2G049100 [Ceratodon purpureus]|nr:hypothetical protein M758_2G049100 [Ceratodon purpureus]
MMFHVVFACSWFDQVVVLVENVHSFCGLIVTETRLSETFEMVQVAFTCVVYPSLTLGYIGQAAYLSKNLSHVYHGFFRSIWLQLL